MTRHLPVSGALTSTAARVPPFLAKGFRPFFLLAAAHACVFLPLWLGVVSGISPRTPYLDPATWHAHEMIFGFTAAVFAGFLLTAVSNWTGRETLTGRPLAGLAALWVLGRAAMLVAGALPVGAAAVIDLAFWPSLAVAAARPLIATRNFKNLVLVAIALALFAADAVTHLDALGVLLPGAGRRACLAAVDVVGIAMLLIVGRVFPMFARNATGSTAIRSIPALDAATIAAAVSMTALDVAGVEGWAPRAAATLAAGFAIARAARWGVLKTFTDPLFGILVAGYLWLVLGLALRAAPGFDEAFRSTLATHAITAGAIGSLTLGMMTRITLGHTGRRLAAGRIATSAFVAIELAALVRVALPLVVPRALLPALWIAGALWLCAFALFLVDHARALVSSRIDGKLG